MSMKGILEMHTMDGRCKIIPFWPKRIVDESEKIPHHLICLIKRGWCNWCKKNK